MKVCLDDELNAFKLISQCSDFKQQPTFFDYSEKYGYKLEDIIDFSVEHGVQWLFADADKIKNRKARKFDKDDVEYAVNKIWNKEEREVR